MSEAGPTLAEINTLVDNLYDYKIQIEVKNNELKAIQELEAQCKANIMAVLEDSGLKSFKARAGTVSVSNRYSVKFPKEPAVKKKLETWLRKRNIYQGMWTINFATLNSFFKAEVEAAEREGRLVDVPGLEPTHDKIIAFRKSAGV
jgi:hypothetical protein